MTLMLLCLLCCLYRDLLKSDSAMVMVPELELELGPGTLGGVFTTVEGLLAKIRRSLQDGNPFAVGDSTTLHHSEDASVVDVSTSYFGAADYSCSLRLTFHTSSLSPSSWRFSANWRNTERANISPSPLYCATRLPTVSSQRPLVRFSHQN